eukprot:3648561-Prymnesium_polylepis.1
MSGLWEPAHAVPRARDHATGPGDLAQEAAGLKRADLRLCKCKVSAETAVRGPRIHGLTLEWNMKIWAYTAYFLQTRGTIVSEILIDHARVVLSAQPMVRFKEKTESGYEVTVVGA